jgi:hypothetical protein
MVLAVVIVGAAAVMLIPYTADIIVPVVAVVTFTVGLIYWHMAVVIIPVLLTVKVGVIALAYAFVKLLAAPQVNVALIAAA